MTYIDLFMSNFHFFSKLPIYIINGTSYEEFNIVTNMKKEVVKLVNVIILIRGIIEIQNF